MLCNDQWAGHVYKRWGHPETGKASGGGDFKLMKEAYQKGREVANTLFIPLPLRSNQPAPLSPCKEIDKEAAASVVALTLRPPPPLPIP
ncbi:hypothetical protein CEXT_80891 [Caerostris extrusa]|uniref:Uncharacterized protein n=1 Tax=Caerostris extrusa TaxID=172846 RepID=A0AAV4M3A1_CAEEX|nr:hypothetical protein CEXT_80891 [Caerostris extrusa]